MPITLLPKDYHYYRQICEHVRLAEAQAESIPTRSPEHIAAARQQPTADESKKDGPGKMMYSDNDTIPEEKMAQMPRYAYPAVAQSIGPTMENKKKTDNEGLMRTPTFNLTGLVPEILELIFQNCDLKFIHQDEGGHLAPPLVVALRPDPRLYFHALAVCYQESPLGWCGNKPSASLSRALPFIKKLNIVLCADKDGDKPSSLNITPEDLSTLLSNNRIAELSFSLSLLHEIIPPLSVLENFVSQLPKWLASFRHLKALTVWIPIACAEGTGPRGEIEGAKLYDNTMDHLINSTVYSIIVRSSYRLVSLFPIFFKADEDSRSIYCEYGRWDWTARPGKVMDWSKVDKHEAEEAAYLLEGGESDEEDSDEGTSEEDIWEDDQSEDE